jgi:hypothetical protein
MGVQSVSNVHQANTNPNTATKRVVSVMSVHFHQQVLLRFVRHVQKDTTKTKKAGHRVFVVYQANTNPKKEIELVKDAIQVNI